LIQNSSHPKNALKKKFEYIGLSFENMSSPIVKYDVFSRDLSRNFESKYNGNDLSTDSGAEVDDSVLT